MFALASINLPCECAHNSVLSPTFSVAGFQRTRGCAPTPKTDMSRAYNARQLRSHRQIHYNVVEHQKAARSLWRATAMCAHRGLARGTGVNVSTHTCACVSALLSMPRCRHLIYFRILNASVVGEGRVHDRYSCGIRRSLERVRSYLLF